MVQVQSGSPCQLQVPGDCVGQKKGLEDLFADLDGGVREVDAYE